MKCRNGPECEYFKRNRCLYHHNEDAREEGGLSKHKDKTDKQDKDKQDSIIERKRKDETNQHDDNKRDAHFLEQMRRNNNRKKNTETNQPWENFY